MIGIRTLVEQLVAIDSVSNFENRPSNQTIADAISNFCRDAGCDVVQHPYLNGKLINVVATKGSGNPQIALSGHTDTVPYDAARWIGGEPLVVSEQSGFLVGRGVSDMKLALATNIVAASKISKRQLKGGFALYFTAEEEIGCLGAKQLVSIADKEFPLAQQIIVCEPTELRSSNRHKGYMYLSIRIFPKPADKHHKDEGKREPKSIWRHSSDDRMTTNVVETYLPRVIEELVSLKDYLRTISHPSFDPPYSTLNIGQVLQSADAAKNTIPIEFEVVLDVRPIADISTRGILELIDRRISKIIASVKPVGTDEAFEYKVELKRQPTPCFLNLDSALPSMLGEQAPIAVSYNSEAGVFQAAGADCVVCGPCSVDSIHKANEKASLRYLEDDVVDFYVQAILSVCGR